MNIENTPILPLIKVGYCIDPKLPILPLVSEVSQTACVAPHSHPRGELIYASSGVIRVICGRDIWVVPPSQAVWVPTELEHQVYFPGQVSMRSLFIDPAFTSGLPDLCTVIKVSPLLRELILKAVLAGDNYALESAQYRLMMVILDELRQAEATELRLPMARDERIMRVIKALLKNPGDNRDIEAWGKVAGASSRTLARLFVAETGLTLGAWRKRLLLQEAVNRLDRGEQVTQVAFDLGYQSMSAFIEMFRKELGAPPRKYTRQQSI